MKIGIFTFNQAINYGAVLQEYALYKVVTGLGYDCEVINYQNKKFLKEYGENKIGIKSKIIRTITLKQHWFKIKKRKFNTFITKHIKMTSLVCDTELKSLEKQFDQVITGSDQVFNLSLTGFDWNYYLSFLPEYKCVAYAPSFGVKSIPEKWDRDMLRAQLKHIRALCVRENSGREIIKTLCDRDVVTVLDPTLLLTKELWTAHVAERIIKQRYLLVYTFEDGDINVYAKNIAKKNNLRIVKINGSSKDLFDKGVSVCNAAGIEEFLSLIYYADMIITNSYHGMLFSFIFEKQFIVFPHKMNEQANDRMKDFLDRYQLAERYYTENANIVQDINYDMKEKKLVEDRLESLNYLDTVLREGQVYEYKEDIR